MWWLNLLKVNSIFIKIQQESLTLIQHLTIFHYSLSKNKWKIEDKKFELLDAYNQSKVLRGEKLKRDPDCKEYILKSDSLTYLMLTI